MGSVCNEGVERSPRVYEVVGFNSAGSCAFSIFYFFHLLTVVSLNRSLEEGKL